MTQERVKVFIVTYKRTPALHVTLRQIFNDTDFMQVYPQAEVYIINNHSEFFLHPFFINKGVKVIDNQARPDWSCGNLGRNWNEALFSFVECYSLQKRTRADW